MSRPLILFDGVCNLCNGSVRWVIARDHDELFLFASLQSEAARAAILAAGADPESVPDSIVLIDESGVHTRSDAAIRIARRLGFPYSMAAVGAWFPRPLRDAIYRLVARNRYRWFGKRDSCMVPTPELASRFLDADETSTAR